MKKCRIYVASPCNPGEGESLLGNINSARLYCSIISKNTDFKPFAPHAYLPFLLDDSIPEERQLALGFGCDLLKMCHALAVCGKRISPGMKGEIVLAAKLGLPIYVANSNCLPDVMSLCQEYNTHISLFDCEDKRLAKASSEIDDVCISDNDKMIYGEALFDFAEALHNGYEFDHAYGTSIVLSPKDVDELVKLEEQGLLLRLPCKVGDTVWVVTSPFNVFEDIEHSENLRDECYEAFISSVTLYRDSVQYRISAKVTNHFIGSYYNEQSFGKTVFLTKEEAEQRLMDFVR